MAGSSSSIKTTSNIDYLCTFYFGRRRCFLTEEMYEKNKYTFLKEQVKYLKKYRKLYNNILFLINDDGSADREIVKELSKGVRDVKIIYRDNVNLSYGAWQEGLDYLVDNNIDSEYAFLNEDDYILVDKNSLQPFIDKSGPKTVFVCGLWRQNHASISFGLLNMNLAKRTNTKKVRFRLPHHTPDNLYRGGIRAQITFMDHYKSFGPHNIVFKDIMDNHFIRFRDPFLKEVIWGNKNGTEIIIPIELEI